MSNSDRADAVSYALWEVVRTAGEGTEALARRMGMPYGHVLALDHLLSSETPMGTVELGRKMAMRSASAAELVARMEAAGLVRRRPHPSDRRRVIIEPTTEGSNRAMAALGPLLTRIEALARDLDARTAEHMVGFLHQIAELQREFRDGEL